MLVWNLARITGDAMNIDVRRLALIGAFIAVCGVAAAAVIMSHQQSSAPAQPAYSQTAPVQPQDNASPADSDSQDGYYSSSPRPAFVHSQDYASAPPVEAQPPEPEPPPVTSQPATYYSDRRSRHHRSKRRSAEIVAGSAGVGAAIGAIAGGGKGAALGGISGGAAGFVYDRLTH